MNRTLLVIAVVVGAGAAMLAGQPAPAPGELTYEIRLIERPVGFERVRITKETYGQRLESQFDIVDRGTPIAVKALFMAGPDFAPLAAEIIGKTYRFVNVDLSVLVENGRASIRHRGQSSATPVSGPFFIARGYAPLAARAWLIKYWESLKRPQTIRGLPEDSNDAIRIAFRGEDRVQAGGRDIRLRRYSVDGVVWGREAVWIDDDDRLAAIVTRIHILPMEAIRTDLKEAFDVLQAAAVADRMKDLEEMRAAATPLAQGTYAIVGARVLSGAGPPIDNATLVVRDGRIEAVGPAASTTVPSGARTFQAKGNVIIPGLWDMHAHAANIEWAPAYLAAGVTTVRDMGGETRYLTAFRDAIAGDRGLGPRLLLAGLVDGAGDPGFGTTIAGSADEGRAVVDRFRGAGFQQVKLYTLLAPDVVSAIAARAHEAGMTVTGHVPRALSAAQGVERGMDHIAHLPVRLAQTAESKALIAALAKRRTVVDPTLSWSELTGRDVKTPIDRLDPSIDRLPRPLLENYRSVLNEKPVLMNAALEAVKAMHDAGVPVVVGTDGALPGLSVLKEIELFFYAGLTAQQAIDAATRVPAAAMGLLAETGTIEAGKRADFVVLDADPLIDITNIRATRGVAVGGRLYNREQLAALAGFRAR
jgi:imidazolonepropionase-like amidohydrolase